MKTKRPYSENQRAIVERDTRILAHAGALSGISARHAYDFLRQLDAALTGQASADFWALLEVYAVPVTRPPSPPKRRPAGSSSSNGGEAA